MSLAISGPSGLLTLVFYGFGGLEPCTVFLQSRYNLAKHSGFSPLVLLISTGDQGTLLGSSGGTVYRCGVLQSTLPYFSDEFIFTITWETCYKCKFQAASPKGPGGPAQTTASLASFQGC